MLYDLGSVEVKAKSELVNILSSYSPPTVINSLGTVFYNLLHSYWMRGYNVFVLHNGDNIELQKLLQVFPEGRMLISGYYFLLANNAVFKDNSDRSKSRKLNGPKAKEISSDYLVINSLTNYLMKLEVSFDVALHTWLAANEEWLQLCSVEWLQGGDTSWLQTLSDDLDKDNMTEGKLLCNYLIYIGELNYFF